MQYTVTQHNTPLR